MKTKKSIPLLAVICVLGLTLNLHAEPKEGHGGGAVVCRNLYDNSIYYAELLDLWEGERFLELNIPRSDDEVQNQFMNSISVFQSKRQMYKDLISLFHSMETSEGSLPPDLGLNLTNDINAMFYAKYMEEMVYKKTSERKQCKLEMVANFGADNVLRKDTEILSIFSKTDVAAMYTHEVLYKAARNSAIFNGEELEDSSKVRELVAHIYAVPQNLEKIAELINKLFSKRKRNHYDIISDDSGSLKLKISLSGESSAGKIYQGLIGVYQVHMYDSELKNPTKVGEGKLLWYPDQEAYAIIELSDDVQNLKKRLLETGKDRRH